MNPSSKAHERLSEAFSFERAQILDTLTNTDGVYGQSKFFSYGNEYATSRGTVELGHHNASDIADLLKYFHLA